MLYKVNDNLYVNKNKIDSVYFEDDTYYIETEDNKFEISKDDFNTFVRKHEIL